MCGINGTAEHPVVSCKRWKRNYDIFKRVQKVDKLIKIIVNSSKEVLSDNFLSLLQGSVLSFVYKSYQKINNQIRKIKYF